MLAHQDRVSRAAREQVSWQLAVGAMLGDTFVQALRQYADLNMGMLRVTLEQGNLVARQLATAQNGLQALSVAAAQAHPGVMRGLDYGYYLGTIIAGMQGGMLQALATIPDTAPHWSRAAQMAEPDWSKAPFSMLKALVESVLRSPVDAARAARVALNLNAPAWESGKLRIAYARPGR